MPCSVFIHEVPSAGANKPARAKHAQSQKKAWNPGAQVPEALQHLGYEVEMVRSGPYTMQELEEILNELDQGLQGPVHEPQDGLHVYVYGRHVTSMFRLSPRI